MEPLHLRCPCFLASCGEHGTSQEVERGGSDSLACHRPSGKRCRLSFLDLSTLTKTTLQHANGLPLLSPQTLGKSQTATRQPRESPFWNQKKKVGIPKSAGWSTSARTMVDVFGSHASASLSTSRSSPYHSREHPKITKHKWSSRLVSCHEHVGANNG